MPYVRAASSLAPVGFAATAPAQFYPPPPPFAPPAYATPPASQAWAPKLGLVVPQQAVEVGDLPRICVVSGQPTDRMKKMRWNWAPSWVAIFVVAGLLPFFLVRELVGDKVSGYLPLHPSVTRRFRLQIAGGLVGFLASLVLLIVSAAQSSGLLAVLALALTVASVLLVFRPGRALPVRRAAPGFVSLPKASPAFVAAFRSGRPAGQLPYTAVPATYRTSKIVIVLAGVLVAFIAVGAVISAMGGANDSGCACGAASSGDQPTVVYRPPGDQGCAVTAHIDAGAVETAIDARNAAVAGFGPVPHRDEDIAAVRATDARLTGTVVSYGMNSADHQARGDYLSALTTYDESLGTEQAAGAAQSLAAQEAAMRQEFATPPGPCTGR
ncbi:hypothetical protein acdb102_32300 [Acidothermaceae bacterium B102]|nr:hypothetical protein acdb102_32300 [Acidothermaceae bacterium B102]